MPDPKVAVQMQQPTVTVDQAQPTVRVEQGQPQVRVNEASRPTGVMAQPSAPAQVTMAPGQPKVEVTAAGCAGAGDSAAAAGELQVGGPGRERVERRRAESPVQPDRRAESHDSPDGCRRDPSCPLQWASPRLVPPAPRGNASRMPSDPRPQAWVAAVHQPVLQGNALCGAGFFLCRLRFSPSSARQRFTPTRSSPAACCSRRRSRG